MTGKRKYDIAFVGLKPGEHEFLYELDTEFFKTYASDEFEQVSAQVKLTLDKNVGFLMLKFDVSGQVGVSCDRCGNQLPIDLWDEFKMIVKLVDNADEMNLQEEDPDVFYLDRKESHLQIADWLYEFVTLSIPTTRMCSDDEMGGKHCNKEVLEKLAKMAGEVAKPQNNIWKGLKGLKGLED